MSGAEMVMAALALLQAVGGLVVALLINHAKRIQSDLHENTVETRSLNSKFEGLIATLHSGFARKEAMDDLGSKFDHLNREVGASLERFATKDHVNEKIEKLSREIGELTARVSHAVKHKEY